MIWYVVPRDAVLTYYTSQSNTCANMCVHGHVFVSCKTELANVKRMINKILVISMYRVQVVQ